MSLNSINVLLVEDSPSDAELLQESLREAAFGPFTFTHVDCWAEALRRLGQETYDVLLLDLSLPDTAGSKTVLRARREAPRLPILVLTGNRDEAVGLEAMRLGVEDYLIKGQTDGALTARSIRYAIERKRAQEELRRARDELEMRVEERTADLKAAVKSLKAEMNQRQAAEQALRESEERYRMLFESAPVGLGVSSYRGEILVMNRHLCEMTGLAPAKAAGTPITAIYAEPAQYLRLVAQAQRAGEVAEQEVPLRRKNGSLLLGLVHLQEFQLGSERGLLTIVRDITRQKQAENHLAGVAQLLKLFATKASRQDYLAAVVKLLADWCHCQGVGIRLLDAQNRLPFTAHTGYDRQFLEHECQLTLSPGGCACVRVLLGQVRPEDAPIASPNGSLFCNHTSRFTAVLGVSAADSANIACVNAGYESLAHAPIRYHEQLLGTLHLADPHPDRFPAETIAFIEATAPLLGEAIHRFKVEEALLESEAHFRSMFERHAAVMLLIDPASGLIVEANPAAAAFYGFPRERLCTMRIEDLNRTSHAASTARRRRALHEKRSSFVLLHRLASGEVRTVEVHASPIQVKERRLLFSIIHDITERKLLEKQVLDISERERQRVGQDLHDSLGGKLAGAALMAKALAHKLAAAALPEAALAEEIVDCFNDAVRQTRAIARGLYPVELGVTGLMSGLADLAVEVERQSGVPCRFQAPRKLVIEDAFLATHLFRIVQEAVNNALRHGQPTEIVIRFTHTPQHVLLEVRDDGKGLPITSSSGNGLGLRTMRYRTELIGGEFAIKPGEKGGTVVSCLLPAEISLDQEAADP